MKNIKGKLTLFQFKNKRSVLTLSALAFVAIMFSGCQTTQVEKKNVNLISSPSYWVFKTNIYAAKKNKNILGYTHVTYMNPKLLRLDIYGPLGLINAGSLVYKDESFEALMPLKKQYFRGIANSKSIEQVLKSPIEPGLFVDLIFQRKPDGKSWICNTDAEGYVRDCNNRAANINIVWKKNISKIDGQVVVTHNEGELDLNLKSSRSISALPAEKFVLRVPNSYSKYKVDEKGIQKL